MKSKKIQDFFSVPLNSLHAEEEIPFDIYLYFSKHNHILLWRAQNEVITQAFIERYWNRGLEKIWIHQSDTQVYENYKLGLKPETPAAETPAADSALPTDFLDEPLPTEESNSEDAALATETQGDPDPAADDPSAETAEGEAAGQGAGPARDSDPALEAAGEARSPDQSQPVPRTPEDNAADAPVADFDPAAVKRKKRTVPSYETAAPAEKGAQTRAAVSDPHGEVAPTDGEPETAPPAERDVQPESPKKKRKTANAAVEAVKGRKIRKEEETVLPPREEESSGADVYRFEKEPEKKGKEEYRIKKVRETVKEFATGPRKDEKFGDFARSEEWAAHVAEEEARREEARVKAEAELLAKREEKARERERERAESLAEAEARELARIAAEQLAGVKSEDHFRQHLRGPGEAEEPSDPTRLNDGEEEAGPGPKRKLKPLAKDETVPSPAKTEKAKEPSPTFAFEDADGSANDRRRIKLADGRKRDEAPAGKPKAKSKAKPKPSANDSDLLNAVQSVSRDSKERQKAVAEGAGRLLADIGQAKTPKGQSIVNKRARDTVRGVLASEKDAVAVEIFDLAEHIPELEHGVEVATFAVLFAMLSGTIDSRALADLAVAGLVHDIGLAFLPPHLLRKPYSEFSDTDRHIYSTHVELGLDWLRLFAPELTGTQLTLIASQHEKLDGTGYPAREKGFSSHEASQFLAMADLLISFGAGRMDGERRTLKASLEHLRALQRGRNQYFSQDLLHRAMNWVTQNEAEEAVEDAQHITHEQRKKILKGAA